MNPFVGYSGALDIVFESAHKLGKGVITLAYMSHRSADDGYGLRLESRKTIFDEFLERAKKWGSDGIILGTTRPEKIRIAREVVGKKVKIICPGSGAQGGDALLSISCWGRLLDLWKIYRSEFRTPRSAVKQISQSLVSTTKYSASRRTFLAFSNVRRRRACSYASQS